MSRPLCASSHASDTPCGTHGENKTTIAIDRCPQCQFRFGWNGTYCRHCWFGASVEDNDEYKAALAAARAKYQAKAALDAADTPCGTRGENKTTIAIDRCPQCQFRYSWNGTYCRHCWFGASREVLYQYKTAQAASRAKYQAEAALDAALRKAAKKKTPMVTAIANTIADIIAVITIVITALASIDLSLKCDSERGFWQPLGEALVEVIGRIIWGVIEGLFSD